MMLEYKERIMDDEAKKILRELSEGQEISWDSIPPRIKDGSIKRGEALGSLMRGLMEGGILQKYQSYAETGDSVYWGNRLAEAEAALDLIRYAPSRVKFRGIRLPSDDQDD